MGEYELYHHGVKGQKWGVITKDRSATRAQKRAAKLEKRNTSAKKAVERHHTKGRAAMAAAGKGVLRSIGAGFLTSGAGAGLMAASLSTFNPSLAVAGMAFLGTANYGYQLSNLYKTGRDIYDIGGVDQKR
jgi:hypothetical protein